ncbi:MAG: nicotinate phosphoribosyltransferase [Candidatus Paceibacterota bacterium]|jgi:nicotinate phosphoribosyltransferase
MKKNEPIIRSLLDLDYYKLTMLRFIFRYYRGTPVKFSFTNRTKSVRIADFVNENELRAELRHVETLRFTKDELDYLAADPHFNDSEFLEFLTELRLPPLHIEKTDGTYRILAQGAWEKVTLWETIVLSVINELYFRSLLKGLAQKEVRAVYAEGDRRLAKKIALLRENPLVTFSEFGTRRRWARFWQKHVVIRMKKEVQGNLAGTSNVHLAMELGLVPIGTMAHELFMALFGIRYDANDPECVARSHSEVLDKWHELYGDELSVALTDTYGTDFFLRTLTDKQARELKGFRQDSGSPYECGDKILANLAARGVDPATKGLVPSDGLTVEKEIALEKYFRNHFKTTSFGYGTDGTNDLGYKALSLVMKLVEANGNPTVKLSDNLAKSLGPPELVEWVKKACGYTNTKSEELVY